MAYGARQAAWRESLALGELQGLQGKRGEREVGREDDGRQDSQAGGQLEVSEGAVQQHESRAEEGSA